jgi:hypothetical protein
MGKGKEVSTERLDQYLARMANFAVSYRGRMLHFLASAERTAGLVASGTSSFEARAIFVIRLAGIASDLRRRFREPILDEAERAQAAFAVRHREECRDRVVVAIATLYAKLSEDELLWIELRRHEQCHPILDGYKPKLSDAENWESFRSTILDGKTLELREISERCGKLEEAAGGFDQLALQLATRVFFDVSAVHNAMIPLLAGL